MLSQSLSLISFQRPRKLKRWAAWSVALITVAAAAWALAPNANRGSLLASTTSLSEVELDQRLQQTVTSALADARGTIIVIDPQTGRVRAVVNPEIAFRESLPPGSTIKPFTTLTALRTGLIDNESTTLCREEYSQDTFHTVCSHPRGLTPLNPIEALAYSCNYYFGKVGERLSEPAFVSTLSEFGFGKKTGINFHGEANGKLVRGPWHSQNAIGETENFHATPIQILNAYSALVNGGHLFVPQVAPPTSFQPKIQAEFAINDDQRTLIVKGLRGAVRYGTAESAGLYSLPNYIFGKTGTATQINGFRTQGWFVGFASDLRDDAPEDSAFEPKHIRLGVLVFLRKAHGSDAAKVARRVFEEFARSSIPGRQEIIPATATIAQYSRTSGQVKVHSVAENVTRTMSLEDYILGVVAAEGSTENEPAAAQALAIASRTYALGNLGRHSADGYDFCSTTHCQRYRATAEDVSQHLVEAVESTSGETIRDNRNQLADAYFSASCGGATANVAKLWGGSAPLHLRGVEDEYCATGKHADWTDVISTAQLQKALRSDPRTNVAGSLSDVSVYRRDETGRADLIAIKGDRQLTISGWEFKIIVGRVLGWNVLKSSRFEIARSGSNFIFRGSGFGHGLGLCQEGAHVMASRGATYRQILSKYFPGSHVTKDVASSWSADVLWRGELTRAAIAAPRTIKRSRRTISGEQVRISFPTSIEQREVESLLGEVQAHRRSLGARLSAAGLVTQLPAIEIFINETTGDFVGRTGQPPWAAAASKGSRIELQPLTVLKRRNVLSTTVRHELVHVVIDSMGGGRTPRWLAEGLAIYFAGEGPLVSRNAGRSAITTDEVEQKLATAKSPEQMKAAYAAAYSEVRRLINSEGESNVWRRIPR
jgi:SpoIID/LytB domain protein